MLVEAFAGRRLSPLMVMTVPRSLARLLDDRRPLGVDLHLQFVLDEVLLPLRLVRSLRLRGGVIRDGFGARPCRGIGRRYRGDRRGPGVLVDRHTTGNEHNGARRNYNARDVD